MINISSYTKQKLSYFFSILRERQRVVAVVLCFQVLGGILNAITPYFLKLQIDQLEQQSRGFLFFQNQSPFLIFAVLMLVPATFELIRIAIFDYFSGKIYSKLDEDLKFSTLDRVWDKLQTFDAGFFESNRTRLILRSIFESQRVVNSFLSFLSGNIYQLVGLAAIIPLLLLVDYRLMLLILIGGILQYLLGLIDLKKEAQRQLAVYDAEDKRHFIEHELNGNFHKLKLLNEVEEFKKEFKRLDSHITAFYEREVYQVYLMNVFRFLQEEIITILISLFVARQVMMGVVSIGSFTLVVSYTTQIRRALVSLAEARKEWLDLDLKYVRLSFLDNLKSRLRTVSHPLTKISRFETVEFNNVSFGYPDFYDEEKQYFKLIQQKLTAFFVKGSFYENEHADIQRLLNQKTKRGRVLKNVNLTLKRGKITALLGRNGAGKTTITKLLTHTYEPSAGKITYDGTPVFHFAAAALYKHVSILEQEPYILEKLTVRENLLLGVDRTVSDKEIMALLEELEIAKLIKSLPRKLNTVIGDDTRFSGGQMQLLAIARILLQDKQVLIFDEGSSQLDVEKERKLLDLLKRKAADSIVLFITHRVTTAKKADYVYMIDHGQIVEEGKFNDLLKTDGLLKHFWKLQVE